MATDATGAPTPLGIPKYNTSADAPSGLGFNAAMDAIDALIAGKVSKPAGIAIGEAAVWNGSSWDRSSVTRLGPSSLGSGTPDVTKRLAGDGSWQPGALVVIDDLTVTGSVLATYDTNTRLGGNIPATYKDLVLVIKGKADVAGDLQMRFNNSSAASYYSQQLEAVAAAPVSAELLAATQFRVGSSFGATAGLGNTVEITALNYTDTAFGPSFRADYWHSTNNSTGTLRKGQSGGVFGVIGAVTRMQAFVSGGNFVIGTRFTLYGRV